MQKPAKETDDRRQRSLRFLKEWVYPVLGPFFVIILAFKACGFDVGVTKEKTDRLEKQLQEINESTKRVPVIEVNISHLQSRLNQIENYFRVEKDRLDRFSRDVDRELDIIELALVEKKILKYYPLSPMGGVPQIGMFHEAIGYARVITEESMEKYNLKTPGDKEGYYAYINSEARLEGFNNGKKIHLANLDKFVTRRPETHFKIYVTIIGSFKEKNKEIIILIPPTVAEELEILKDKGDTLVMMYRNVPATSPR